MPGFILKVHNKKYAGIVKQQMQSKINSPVSSLLRSVSVASTWVELGTKTTFVLYKFGIKIILKCSIIPFGP